MRGCCPPVCALSPPAPLALPYVPLRCPPSLGHRVASDARTFLLSSIFSGEEIDHVYEGSCSVPTLCNWFCTPFVFDTCALSARVVIVSIPKGNPGRLSSLSQKHRRSEERTSIYSFISQSLKNMTVWGLTSSRLEFDTKGLRGFIFIFEHLLDCSFLWAFRGFCFQPGAQRDSAEQ